MATSCVASCSAGTLRSGHTSIPARSTTRCAPSPARATCRRPAPRRTAGTSYKLTADGETEFLIQLREALWNVAPHSPADLLAAWSFAWAFTREEVIAAFEHRLAQIAAAGQAAEFAVADLGRDPEKPGHVVEHVRLTQARLDGEANWTRTILDRLSRGEYWFHGEPDPPWKRDNAAKTITRTTTRALQTT
jgi:hypothetical protein